MSSRGSHHRSVRKSLQMLTMRSCVDRRSTYGGTAPDQVENQIAMARDLSKAQLSFCQAERERLIGKWNELTYSL